MPDCAWAKIEIGGTITKSKLSKLLLAVSEYYKKDLADEISLASREGRVAVFKNDDVPYGRFSFTESLTMHGLFYRSVNSSNTGVDGLCEYGSPDGIVVAGENNEFASIPVREAVDAYISGRMAELLAKYEDFLKPLPPLCILEENDADLPGVPNFAL